MPDDIDDLLHVHEIQRRAHLEGDAELFATTFGDRIVEASGGGVRTLTRQEMRDRFARAFTAVRYHAWADIEPPTVAVEGDTGWMVIHVRASRSTAAGEALPDFEASWIAVYARTSGTWLLEAISSSVVEIAPTG